MNSALSLYNLAVWIAQVLLITSIGALLPLVFRVRHPRSNLVYYRLLLAAALLLPLIQPVQHEVVLARAGLAPSTPSPASTTQVPSAQQTGQVDWRNVILGLLVTGFIVRLGWLGGGLWQLHRLRNSSTPLYPLPRSVQNALANTKAEALFGVSRTIKGSVTFGFWRPVILLPKSFLEMPGDAQNNIACHELLHVRRSDWLATILEEFVTSILWFQPAVWWIVAQSQLAREQLVDAAVVSMTASRESYIDTLFSLANAKWEADVGVASLFLKRRHLIHRVHSLLMEVSMSRMRLLASYCSIAVILAIGGGLTLVALPLTEEAELRHLAAEEQPRPVQTSPGYVVNRSPISYPTEARQKRIEGTVVVELTFNARGQIVDARVLSGPEELRQAGLQTAVQGQYAIDIARTLQVVVDFKLPAPGQRGTSPTPAGVGARGGARGPAAGSPPNQARALDANAPPKLRVGANVVARNLITQIPPVYPLEAQRAQIQGAVILEANINKDGRVESVNVISGDALLVQAARDAVMQWVYRPMLLNGQPVDIVTTITINIP